MFGTIVICGTLLIYTIIIHYIGLEKKDKKWLYVIVMCTVGLSFTILFQIGIEEIIVLLNNSIGELTRMVVSG